MDVDRTDWNQQILAGGTLSNRDGVDEGVSAIR